MTQRFDIAIAGGGLAGSLIALALKARRPDLSVVIVEAGDAIGGNHVWSFFASDIARANRTLVDPLCAARWDGGYEVHFPAFSRMLKTPYRSVTSENLAAAVAEALPADAIRLRQSVSGVEAGGIALDDGSRIEADGVIDARGLSRDLLSNLNGGWQKFVGAMLECDRPHGISRPVVMDATVDQLDGYRFVYVLPFSDRHVFVEDTYYSDAPDLERNALLDRIAAYADAQGWQIAATTRVETGVLPVVTGGDFDAFWRTGNAGVGRAGVRAGLFQPLTSYSLPDAVRFASSLADLPKLDSTSLARFSRRYAERHWRRGMFYRTLAKMLFGASAPQERYKVLQRFYGLDERLIERFYAGLSTFADMARVLAGKPPVPVTRAAMVLAGIGAPGALEGTR
ncbi:lycopene beta-cyclase CrtY [Croceicoccus bisphenolivorans]|uniref:lycopene beta-cyclase CrtY n=1 Tax=Croceicoccus bisphenolivorans TaxID=1783232 RepID=UPI0008376356|nr:lycopene beta-cyclase CrtY [Croceicoccus bisphenolivorans]